MTEVNMDDFIQTFDGEAYYFQRPTADMISIENIAHTLSLLCRFGGHVREFYSVAQHSVLCSMQAPDEFKFEALLHDSSEAYLVDIPRPIKRALPQYMELEGKAEKAISEHFGIPHPMSKEVKEVDNRMLFTEARDLMNPTKVKWIDQGKPYDFHITPWTPKVAAERFLDAYYLLRPLRKAA